MRRRLLRIGILAGLCLLGSAVRAQDGDKVSVPPIPETEKEKLGVVDSLGVAVEADIYGVDDAGQSLTYNTFAYGDTYAAHHDTSAVVARVIPERELEGFRNNPNYQYDRVETGGPTLFSLFWQWLDDVLFHPLRENTTEQFWSWFWMLAGVAALAFVISKALGADSGWFFRKKDEEVEIAGLELLDTEDIESVDLDALLEAALHGRRYRDAARYQYLQALQTLTEQGLINWDKHKTNLDYLAEVRSADRPNLDAPFADITRLFEWIWYGEFPVDEQRFSRVRARFDLFSEALREAHR